MEHENQCGGHQPEQLLEQPQVSLAFFDKVVRIKDEESAPLHTEVEADDAEVHGAKLGENLDHTQPLSYTAF